MCISVAAPTRGVCVRLPAGAVSPDRAVGEIPFHYYAKLSNTYSNLGSESPLLENCRASHMPSRKLSSVVAGMTARRLHLCVASSDKVIVRG